MASGERERHLAMVRGNQASVPWQGARANRRRTTNAEVWSSDQPWLRLLLDPPLLLEVGQKYWLDPESESVIVEDAEGHRQSFSGHQGDAAERPR